MCTRKAVVEGRQLEDNSFVIMNLEGGAQETKETTKIVEEADIITAQGFNYVKNPIQAYGKKLIESGKLGQVINFRESYDQDYYAEDDQKHEWRMFKSSSASGALGDLASHTISLSQYFNRGYKRIMWYDRYYCC